MLSFRGGRISRSWAQRPTRGEGIDAGYDGISLARSEIRPQSRKPRRKTQQEKEKKKLEYLRRRRSGEAVDLDTRVETRHHKNAGTREGVEASTSVVSDVGLILSVATSDGDPTCDKSNEDTRKGHLRSARSM